MKRFNGTDSISWELVCQELEVTDRTVRNYRSDMCLDEETFPECSRTLLARLQLMSIFTSLGRSKQFSRRSFIGIEGNIFRLQRIFKESGILESPASPAFPELSVSRLIEVAYCQQEIAHDEPIEVTAKSI